MESVIKTIFSGKTSSEAHLEFVKYSRGIFENKYMLEAKKQGDKYSIKTSNEFANFFVRTLAEKAGESELEVSGVIVSTRNLKEVEGFSKILANVNVKQFMGIKQFAISQKLKGKDILKLIETAPASFFALSFKYGESELKIKPKAPKSAKPSTKTKDEGPKVDFCSLKTSDKSIIGDLFFDFADFKAISISHTLEVKDIELPKVYKTPEEMREKAIRKGVVKRIVEVDGKKEVKEKNFVA